MAWGDGALRVRAPRGTDGAGGGAPSDGDPYLQRLVKLVPSEVLTLYLALKEVAASWIGVWALICLFLVILVRAVGTHDGKRVQAGAVAVATVSFALWVYATGGHILNFEVPATPPGIVSAAIAVWTFIIPYMYKGDKTG